MSFETFCVENGINYFIDEEQWLYFGDLIQEVPLQVYNVERFLKKNKSLTFIEDQKRYFLQIADYKLKDSVSPLSLQKEKIRNIILNRRKLDLLSKMRDDLYQEAVSKNRIQTSTCSHRSLELCPSSTRRSHRQDCWRCWQQDNPIL